ncbi:MAG: DUF559 domain-containing protein [Eggerthellaceae bacterium]|nr:DUF559 domain-containing protein [Eggerthellaceae bacterium]
MRICLCGDSAVALWRHYDNRILGRYIFGHTPNAGPTLPEAFPSKQLLSSNDPSAFDTDLSLLDAYGRSSLGIPLGKPVHLLVDRSKRNHTGKRIVTHSTNALLPRGSILELQAGIHSLSPEYLFIRTAEHNDLIGQIMIGYELTGCYSIRHELPAGFTQHPPLCSRETISELAKRARGTRATAAASKALAHVLNGSGSPRETGLAMMLCLPNKLGGWGLPTPELNKCLHLGKNAEHYWGEENSFDMVWEKAKLIVEYDGKCHDEESQRKRDALRRDATILAGYSVYVITKDRLETVGGTEVVARSVAKLLGKQIRIRCNDFPRKNYELWQRVIRSRHP